MAYGLRHSPINHHPQMGKAGEEMIILLLAVFLAGVSLALGEWWFFAMDILIAINQYRLIIMNKSEIKRDN